ncbi:MucB/RseB C-terminal domain-containing protein [Gilvimarinus xylanilyticus]|uniref:MucB/RseB C-terminal domain-containing protein n=1 Tax=Gilvimarinus xylanilyticus TaxID=2944139 RepID=A0A9X2I397_9GAMM|nr:MucB/RseB C-terminal domain-containing protein [Gilvimarinus xylanilyticus]MCP8899196.1 MucB/RseB C-terminal domain-containing protein [Gilvimarinus xylanilyticus]
MNRFTGALLLWCFSLSAVQAQPNSDASPGDNADPAQASIRSVSELLATMAEHHRHLNYRGTFTHQDTNGTDSFRLEHWVRDGVEHQRVYYLQGPEREALIDKPLDCRSTGEMLLANRAKNLEAQRPELEKLYNFRLLGLDRIAGRPTTMLHIVPRDPFRFGFLFGIDRETGLVTKSILLDEKQRPLEQFQYVELETNVAPEQFAERADVAISHQVSAASWIGCGELSEREPATWQLGWMPEGFEFAGQRQVNNKIQMLMYTDGLSTFSVFLDPAAQDVAIEARARRGATNFYLGGVKQGADLFQLTVIGEVPADVAERIGQSISPKT